MQGLDLITFEEVSGRRVAVFAIDLNACRVRVPADAAERERWLARMAQPYLRVSGGGGWPVYVTRRSHDSGVHYAMRIFQHYEEIGFHGAMVIHQNLPWGTAYVALQGVTGIPYKDDPLRIVYGLCHRHGHTTIATYVQNRSDRKHQRPARRAYIPIHKIRPDQLDHLRLVARLLATSWRPGDGL